ncbi:MAG TPA: toll/interleukin-1 receptor domain-containing protein [Pseudonocardiaceae bacterium]|nr:toll/interleukin-1 receptor domain-containing protein [Pseudonocardiaceae bacterium]
MDFLNAFDESATIISATLGTIEIVRRLHRLYATENSSSLDQIRASIFPDARTNAVVTTGMMNDPNDLDPEDSFAAIAALRSLRYARRKSKLTDALVPVDAFPQVGADSNVFAIGGPLSNPLNKFLGHTLPLHHNTRPSTPIYLRLNSRTRHKVIRSFDGRRHERPMWVIVDQERDVTLEPRLDSEGWITCDFLLLTRVPLNNSRNVQVSAVGLYGPGIMGLKLLLENSNDSLRQAVAARGEAPYFQSLFAIDQIKHDRFSRGRRIRHVSTYLLPAQVTPWQSSATTRSVRRTHQPSAAPATDIFVNYRTDDEPFGATFIDRELSSHFGPDAVFRDSRSIRPGDDFTEKILPAVRAAKALLAVIGPRWLAATDVDGRPRLTSPDDWVRREIAEAFRHGVRVIPVLLDAELPAERDLPAEINQLARCQYVRVHHRAAEYDVLRLISELTELVPGLIKDR